MHKKSKIFGWFCKLILKMFYNMKKFKKKYEKEKKEN